MSNTPRDFHHYVTLSSQHCEVKWHLFVHKENQDLEKLNDFPRLTQQEAEMGSYPLFSKFKGSSGESHPHVYYV